jgi:hypothetical protein
MPARLPLRPRTLAALLLAAVSSACGARSALLDAGGAGGASASTSGTGGATVTGTGGASPACLLSDLTATFPFDDFADETASSPQLIPLDDIGERWALTLIGQTGMGFPRLWHTQTRPWSPPVNAVVPLPGAALAPLLDPVYAVTRSATEGAYALEIPHPPASPGVVFDPAVVPGASSPGLEIPLISQFQGPTRPSFVARRPWGSPPVFEHLAGYERSENGNHQVHLRMVSPTWGNPEHGPALACADRAIPVRGTGTLGAFFTVAASSRPLGQCEVAGDSFGAPTRLQVTFYNQPLGQVLNPLAEFQEDGPIEAVDVALGDGWLWVAWATVLDEKTARLRLARVGLTGTLLAGPADLTLLTRPSTLSIARFGDRLATAVVQVTEGGQRFVTVRTLKTSDALDDIFLVVPESVSGVAIAGEPNGKRLLLAVTQDQPAAEGKAILVSRYGCL